MRRDMSLGIPISSRHLRGIGIPRYIAAPQAQACEKFGPVSDVGVTLLVQKVSGADE